MFEFERVLGRREERKKGVEGIFSLLCFVLYLWKTLESANVSSHVCL